MKEKIFKRVRTFKYKGHFFVRERYLTERGIEYIYRTMLKDKFIEKQVLVCWENYSECYFKRGLLKVLHQTTVQELVEVKMDLYKVL